jgi:hypothetical protein
MFPPGRHARGGVKSVALSQGIEPVMRARGVPYDPHFKKMCSRHDVGLGV